MSAPITVSLVDDDPVLRKNLAELLERSGAIRCVSSHASGEEALRLLPRHGASVVLMDLHMPGGKSGLDCIAQLKALHPAMCIVVLTTYDDSDSIFDALRAGASGYLLKRASSEVLVKAIQEAHGGGAPMSSQIARQVVQYFHAQKRPAHNPGNLTAREQELISLLATGHQYKEIADALAIAVDTVRSHIRRVYEKLHAHSRTEAVGKYFKTPER
jgi:DNA-binding NarL/FixJ family response regulator